MEIQTPAWEILPEKDPRYFRTWQRVSVVLQKAMRRWIPEIYFRDLARFEDREAAYQLIVYAASRPCYGRPKTEFTYDISDPDTLPTTLRTIGQSLRNVLGPIEQRLREAGQPRLARRYLPVWYQDILNDVRKKPKLLTALLAREAKLIDAVIDLG